MKGDAMCHSIVTNNGYLIYHNNRRDMLINAIERYLHTCEENGHRVRCLGEYSNGKPVVGGSGCGYYIWNIKAIFTEHGATPRWEGNGENMIILTATEPYCDRFYNPCTSVTDKKAEDKIQFTLNEQALDELFKED